MFKKRYLFILIVSAFAIGAWFLSDFRGKGRQSILNVYNWYGMIDRDIIKQFEKETGISVRIDFYDNNEMVETKLLAGHSGYDIVFPSVMPYVPRLIGAGALEEINMAAIPNLHFLDSQIMQKIKFLDPDKKFIIPYFWGALGIAYNKEKIEKILKEHNLTYSTDDYSLLFDPKILKVLNPCGITLLEESIDIYPTVQRYLGLDTAHESVQSLKQVHHHLLRMRPFISHLSTTRFVSELKNGETCVAQAWSGDAHLLKGEKEKFMFIIPKGSTLWIDGIVIPKHSPNKKNAYRFISFLFRPDIAALISNRKRIPIAHSQVKGLLSPEIANDPTVYIPSDKLNDVYLDVIYTKDYQKVQTRLWNEFRATPKG